MTKTARLMYNCDANMRYATELAPSDPFWWYQAPDGKSHILLSALELEHGSRDATVDYVHDFGQVIKAIREQHDEVTPAHIVSWLIDKTEQPDVIKVPSDFAATLFVELTRAGHQLEPVKGAFFNGRVVKTQENIERERLAQRTNELAFARFREILTASEIGKDNVLLWQGNPLTSEIAQGEVNAVLAKAGCDHFNGGPIIAGGMQATDPHERGHGELRGNEFIIMDCFPRYSNGYNGDLTRTFFKGQPTQWHKDVYAAVQQSQQLALDLIKPGANGKEIHQAVAKCIEEHGFKTGRTDDGKYYGFFHGTGHGVGLEVHDFPRGTISGNDWELAAGHITSVEPGLYYPPGTHTNGMGGCRIEDVVAVVKGGIDNLTTVSKDDWVID